MFVEQAAGAIENSRAFEDTLIGPHRYAYVFMESRLFSVPAG